MPRATVLTALNDYVQLSFTFQHRFALWFRIMKTETDPANAPMRSRLGTTCTWS